MGARSSVCGLALAMIFIAHEGDLVFLVDDKGDVAEEALVPKFHCQTIDRDHAAPCCFFEAAKSGILGERVVGNVGGIKTTPLGRSD